MIFLSGLIAAASSVPAGAMLHVRGEFKPIVHAVPGQVIERKLRVINETEESQRVHVYLVDEWHVETGNVVYRPAGTHDRSLAPWITVDRPKMTVPPGQGRDVYYRITIPKDDAPTGTYWAVMMIEDVGKNTDFPAEVNRGDLSVAFRVRLRQAISLRVHFADPGVRRLSFRRPSLAMYSAEEGTYELVTYIVNEGDGEITTADVSVDVYDATGHLVTTQATDVSSTLPGQARRVRLNLGPLAYGHYEAIVVADIGDDDLFGARYRLNVSRQPPDESRL